MTLAPHDRVLATPGRLRRARGVVALGLAGWLSACGLSDGGLSRIQPDSGATGGSGSGGGGAVSGGSGSGGSQSSGGRTGTGGSTGSGDSPGSGGVVGSGGATGTGGRGKGGAPGTGGQTGTGGTVAGGSGGTGGDGGASGSGGSGGAGGSTVPTCAQLIVAYQAEMPNAKTCNDTLDRLACSIPVPSALGCACQTYVDVPTRLNQITKQWTDMGCVRICPAILCILPQPGHCVPPGSAAGTCQDLP